MGVNANQENSIFLRKKVRSRRRLATTIVPVLIKEKDTKPSARDLQPGLVSDEER